MTDEVGNLVLEQLRPMLSTLDFVAQDVADLKPRMSAVENHLGQIHIQAAGLNSRMDRFDERMARIERRLDLVDA